MIEHDFLEHIERRLAEDIRLQRERLVQIARQIKSNLTDEDLLQPHDVRELDQSAQFNFEDGVLAGLLQAQMLLRASRQER